MIFFLISTSGFSKKLNTPLWASYVISAMQPKTEASSQDPPRAAGGDKKNANNGRPKRQANNLAQNSLSENNMTEPCWILDPRVPELSAVTCSATKDAPHATSYESLLPAGEHARQNSSYVLLNLNLGVLNRSQIKSHGNTK